MKIKSALIAVAAMAIIAAVFYLPAGWIRGGQSEEQKERVPVKRPDYSAKISQIEAEFNQREMDIERRYEEIFSRLSQDRQDTIQKLKSEDKEDRAEYDKRIGEIKPASYRLSESSGAARTAASKRDEAASDYREKSQERNEAAGAANEDYYSDREYFERQKELALSDLQKEKQQAIEQVYSQQAGKSVGKIASGTCGMVTAITSSDGASIALIDGEVLREGQSIHGVKIIKISPACVEFGYAGKTWSQRIKEWPSDNWP